MSTFTRVVFVALAFLAVAHAFTAAPLKSSRVIARSVTASAQPQMAFEAASSQIATVTNALLASKETDFGGYTGPAVALVVLGILISVLTNPYDDLKQ